jgi:exodeoxyribonuclease-5
MVASIDIITGAAGTGKTTAIKELLDALPINKVMILAPTNRAAKVLRSKQIPARTIHKGLYKTVPTGDYVIEMLPVIDEKTGMPKMQNGETIYYEHEKPIYEHAFDTNLPSDLTIIIDEASMVPSKIWKDIFENFTGNLVVVGDPNQLMPVEGEEDSEPDYLRYFNRLAECATVNLGTDTNNRRLAENTEGISCAIKHIMSNKNPLGNFPELHGFNGYYYCDMRNDTGINEATRELIYCADIVVCWTNNERNFLNTLIRKNLSTKMNRAYTEYPIVGDRIIADGAFTVEDDEGNVTTNITKGDDLEIVSISEVDAKNNLMWVKLKDIPNAIPLSVAHITGERVPKGISALRWLYGYAVTCHKAQGSGWNTVLVIDSYSRPEDAKRWRYTAATRAIGNLIVMRSGISFDKRKLTGPTIDIEVQPSENKLRLRSILEEKFNK